MSLKAAGVLLLAVITAACSGGNDGPIGPIIDDDPQPIVPPALLIEMRGMWIATVANIDWPSRSGLSADQQQAELISILDGAAATGINAVVLQVRPAADALYESAFEPWGAMLTGVQGNTPGYDPLAFAIDAAHARGMELHAWINPFRAGNTRDTARLAPLHVYHSKRDLVRIYGGNLWLDPGEPQAQEHSLRVIKDIVTRYDIDALHADDYFYPYPVKDPSGGLLEFPDETTFAKYGAGMTQADWRRDNINRFVQRLYAEVHAIKPSVKVGISPFGIWRPGHPPGVQGLDAYASIYADSRKWLQEGWVDYLAPQLYWAISAPQQSFPALLDWWVSQNVAGRHIWPGLAAYRVQDGSASAFTAEEIPSQIQIARARGVKGHLLYNTSWTLKRNSGQLASTLASGLYRERAVIPASPWLDSQRPAAPTLARVGDDIDIVPAPGEQVRWWVVRKRAGGQWTTKVQFGSNRRIGIDAAVSHVVVHAADAAMNLSAAATLTL